MIYLELLCKAADRKRRIAVGERLEELHLDAQPDNGKLDGLGSYQYIWSRIFSGRSPHTELSS